MHIDAALAEYLCSVRFFFLPSDTRISTTQSKPGVSTLFEAVHAREEARLATDVCDSMTFKRWFAKGGTDV
jgi:hypothetical protein